MRKRNLYSAIILSIIILFLVGCSRKDGICEIYVQVTTPIEADSEMLYNISVALPEGMTREKASDIQHDFLLNGQQVGGIVVVDISEEMLDSPRGENLLSLAKILGEQLMPQEDPNNIEYMCAGGNSYAYLELYTGGERIRYCHYLLRGEEHNYDIWFACDFVDEDTRIQILSTVSGEDITAERNQSVM